VQVKARRSGGGGRRGGASLAAVLGVAGLLAAASDQASAGVLGRVAGDLTGGAVGGAVEKLEPALARTLADVDGRLAANEVRVGSIVGDLVGKTSGELGTRLTQVDGILEKRLLQVQLGVDQVLDHGLDKIDGVARARIAQLNGSLAARITQVDEDAQQLLASADQILKDRVADVDKIVKGAVDRADGALQARIEQIDEVAGRRLGNVDVIATKQRLGLERTLIRAAWIIGLVAFVIAALKALWTEYLKGAPAIAAAAPGRARAWRTVALLSPSLVRHVAVAAAIALLLATVPERLPMAAAADEAALIRKHASELERSLAALDWTRVRFHASQLELLEPVNAARYQALAAKGELLRDVLGKPTALATAAGASAILAKAAAVERVGGGHADPDAQTVRAMVAWQLGRTKRDEHEAAARAARALLSTPRGFTLAPLARLMVEAYLHAPLPAEEEAPDLESSAGLAAILQRSSGALARAAEAGSPGSPFEGTAALFHLMRRLDAASSEAYTAMVAAQVEVAQLEASAAAGVSSKAEAKRGDKRERAREQERDKERNQEREKKREQARERRNAAAARVVTAWEDLDRALRERPIFDGQALVLAVFRLNDALLTHALWFTTDPGTSAWPPRLADLSVATPEARARKLALAPARAVWARRYADLLAGPARELVELQEADRFEELERRALDFERAMAVLNGVDIAAEAPADGGAQVAEHPRRRGARREPSSSSSSSSAALPGRGVPSLNASPPLATAASPEALRELQAANAAAALGLYETRAGARVPLAVSIGGSVAELEKKARQAVGEVRAPANRKLTGAGAAADAALEDAVEGALRSLRDRLLGRVNRLI